MKKENNENDKNSNETSDLSVDLFSLVFHKTMFLNEQDKDREAIRAWLHTHDTSE